MMRVRLMGVCVAIAVGASAVFATGASALEAPEIGQCLTQAGGKYTNDVCTKPATGKKVGKYEWRPGAIKNKFTGVGGAATLETVQKVKVTCKTERSAGEYTSSKTVGNIEVVFTGCEATGFKCDTAHAAEGEIVTNLLSGAVRWENATKSKVAIDLVPQSTELFVEFQCGPAPAQVKGSVMTNIPVDVVKTVFVQKFTAKNGKQKPEYYYTSSGEKVKDVLMSKLGGVTAEFEQAGQTVTNNQTDEEPLELNRYI